MDEGIVRIKPDEEKAKSILKMVNGFKTEGEGAHKKLIEYLKTNYKQFSQYEISTIDDLRIIRNRIAYEGFFVKEDYLKRKRKAILKILAKLMNILKEKLSD